MNINNLKKMQKSIEKLILFLGVIFLPLTSSSQNSPILSEIVLDSFCFGSSGVITFVPVDPNNYYHYVLGNDTVFATEIPIGSGNWVNAPFDSVFTAVDPGTYYIALYEAPNPSVFFIDTIIILDPQDSITTVTTVSQNLICHGDSTGVAEVIAIGGVLPYSYFWPSTGSTTTTEINLWVGFHDVIVTDANGCAVTASVEIENIYSPFNVDLDTIQQVQCYGECNGEVILNVNSGGVSPYTFNWSTGQNYFGPGVDVLSNLCQGGYQVLISDAYGCDTVVSFIISEPTQLYAQAISIQPVQCFGFNDGQAYSIATGGAALSANDYTYSWNPISGNSDTITNLTPEIHTVTVTDTNGCIATDTVLITEPTQLYVEIPDSSVIYSYCYSVYAGVLVAQAYGGIEAYNYSWDNTVQLTDSVFGLHAGIYTVTVFDDRACTASATFDLDSITNTFNSDSVNSTVNHISCYALYDGSVTINSISGSQYPPYDYYWTGPPPFTTTNSASINGLYNGNYAVTIEDSLGCTMILDVDVQQPDVIEYSIDYTVNESCVGASGSSCNGSVILNINGGTRPYFYDNSFSGVFPISSVNQGVVINDTLITNFCNGMYDMHITDVNGCQGYVLWGGSFTANIGSDVIVVNPGIDNAPLTSCFNSADGSAQLIGGINPLFNYSWQSDNSGVASGLILGTGGTYNNFVAGDYWLVAHYEDSSSFGINYAGCDVPYSFTVAAGNMISTSPLVTNPTCFGSSNGSIALNTTGDAPIFSFLWDTLTSIPPSNYTLENQLQLSAGTYTVSITDADGCVLVESFLVNEPSPIIANFVNLSNVKCNGDSDGEVTVLVDPSSGQAPFTYLWSNSQTTSSLTALSGGVYTVTVTDSSGLGCASDFNVTILEPSPILASVEPNSFWGEDDFGDPFHIKCNGESNGSIVVGSVGGSGSVSFSWKNSIGTIVSTSQETGPILPAGSYNLSVTDANGCLEDTTIVLNEPNLILPNISDTLYDFDGDGIGTEVSCFSLFDGWALSSPSGGYPGTQGYSYNWVNSNGQNVSSQALAANLPALLSYTVSVTDMNGCYQNGTTVVFSQPLLFDAIVTTTNYGGPTHAPFSVNFVDNTTSTDSYTYDWSWDDGVNDNNLDFSSEDIGLNNVYLVLTNTITGCMDTAFFAIEIQGVPDLNNVFTPNSDGINDEFFFGEFGMKTVSVEFYNRWGQMVYTWNGADKSWGGIDISGEDVPEGVYFYALVAEGEDGYYYDMKGSITLLR
jgi:gliding motility-associated-like protein